MADEVANVALTKVVPTETTITPYYDDFSEDKNFHRVLFKPGHAVQARELTQMQTIQQNQIERFGSHVFQNGSIVHGGQISYDVTAYINLQSQYLSTDVIAKDFIGKKINDASGNNTFEASVITGREKTASSNPTLMIAYRSGEEFNPGQTVKVSGEEVYASIIVDPTSYTGSGTVATINDSVFFFNGYFVKKAKETIVVDPYTGNANAKIGLEFTEEVITVDDDLTLLDPAQEASNYQAPGADRLKVSLKFTTRPLDSEDSENFIELLRLENGVKTKQTVYPIYSVLGETFARRTFDESGHYTVYPFKIRVADHPTDDTKIRLYLSPGKAYVRGYELETISETAIDIDRARDTQSLNNIDILANYGNDTIVKDLYGFVNLSKMPLVDLHVVTHDLVDATSNTSYDQTKIGTARIRSFEYYAASNTANAMTHTYDTSLFDLQFKNITSNVETFTRNTVTETSTVTLCDLGQKFTYANGAYSGATLRFVSGTANGNSYLITDYDGSNAGVNAKFTVNGLVPSTLTNADGVSIDGSFAIVESLVSSTAYTSNAEYDVGANIADNNRNVNGYTYLFDQKLNSLIFKAPYKYISPASISEQQYQYSKVFESAYFSSGVCLISVNPTREAFNGADGTGSSSTVLDNFIVLDVNNGGVPITLDSVSVNGATGVATLNSTALDTGPVLVIAKVNINDGSTINPKAKALYTANTNIFSNNTVSCTFTSATLGSTIDLYLTDSQAVITNPTKLTGAKQYLHVSDVRRVTKIYDTEGCTLTPGSDISGCKDVTNRFSFNNGQKDSHYDYAWIELKPRMTAPKGPLVVCFDWYDHVSAEGDDRGYFDVDSYPNINTTAGYADVPIYVDSNGITYDLRDCIDFRPRRKNCEDLIEGYELQGIRIPNQATNFECDLSYYLARADLMVVSKSSSPPFVVQKGISSLSPVYPKSIDGTMPIYKINLNPYTTTKDDVRITFIENKRYTMRDIGLLEQRIQNLEYYTSLSLLEKSATDMLIKDPNGLDRTKNGILVDNFFTHGIGDVWNPDYWISMDKVYGAAAPPINTALTKFFPVGTAYSPTNENLGTKTGKKLTMLDYTEVPAIVQPYATKCITIQPYQAAKYIGVMVMDPPADFFTDQQKAPDLVINAGGENDNIILGPPTGCAPNQEDHRCIRGKKALINYINSLGYGTFISTKSHNIQSLKAFGQTLTIQQRMSLANLVNTALCAHHDVGVWATGRGSILSSWFGTTTR